MSMKGSQIRNLLIMVLIMIFLNGCSATIQTEQVQLRQPPEPYTKAVEALSKPDIDMALTYLDLVIKDFPNNSEYQYKSHLLKSIIYSNYAFVDSGLLNDIAEGAQRGKVFLTNSDIDRLLAYCTKIVEKETNRSAAFLTSAQYIAANYNDVNKGYIISLIKPAEIPKSSAINSVDWFIKIGTPIPTNEEFDSAFADWEKIGYSSVFNNVLKMDTIDYPIYFYQMSKATYQWDKSTSKILAQKVIDITENDKYNENRIKAEKDLNTKFQPK